MNGADVRTDFQVFCTISWHLIFFFAALHSGCALLFDDVLAWNLSISTIRHNILPSTA